MKSDYKSDNEMIDYIKRIYKHFLRTDVKDNQMRENGKNFVSKQVMRQDFKINWFLKLFLSEYKKRRFLSFTLSLKTYSLNMNQILVIFVGLFCLTLSISAQQTGIKLITE